ncbi:uncharacterized protein LOC6642814 isoform X1 [Drosophila willistoni]|uniref:uncharacterized protein LOC6642814 isoform X1 n=1 Tax=Drosophila willistoni TaxID=7260 RepID=UPI000C26CDA5|nr:uncharacterized protein LOC6642814 isoform X1 [Drosophila willistoni]
MLKICIFTFVIVAAAAAAAATTTIATATAATTKSESQTITNDLATSSSSSSHAYQPTPTANALASSLVVTEASSEMKHNQTTMKISTEMQKESADADEGNDGDGSSTSTSTSTATPTTTATTSTTTTAATTRATATTSSSSSSSLKLMTTTLPSSTPSPPLSSIKDALQRLKLSEMPAPATTTTTIAITTTTTATEEPDEFTSPLNIQMQAAASYQVAETLADLNEEERARYDAMLAQQPTASKLNIVDLYPLKIEDMQPIIETDNEELLRQRTIFTQPENLEDFRQNLMPNEVEMMLGNEDVDKLLLVKDKLTTMPNDFAGKLLADQDDLITEIENKFQLHETTTVSSSSSSSTTAKPASSTLSPLLLQPGDTFIDRRVKKSFEFPLQHRASDVMAMPHVDFANTKFQTDSMDSMGDNGKANGGGGGNGGAAMAAATHPEFSTTKFYNSKELYNEMLLHNKRKMMKETKTTPTAGSIIKSSSTTSSSEATTLSSAELKTSQPATKLSVERVTLTPAMESFSPTMGTATTTTTSTSSSTTTTSTLKPRKYQKELKRAKLLLKALTPPKLDNKLEVVSATKVKITTLSSSTTTPAAGTTTTTTAASPPSAALESHHLATMDTANPTKAASKPIARPRILSRLQEKINSLECEIQTVPQDSHLWRGNETHELLLPIVTTEHCKPDEHCIPNVLTWRGEAEIQSGDILIVEINDAMLNPSHEPNNTSSAVHATQVYQVTRSGHEHCDVTEGVLLDITPLVVDGRKLVTLYDKDLTEGVNLLIVVSELWGTQCVRLKVTTKTDNCGENADCSGKGVCYSNGNMEEYECQCCSGFAGPHCEEIDACNPSPCTNNGICVDLSQGHEGNSYQCLCPYGYAGKNCQYESDPCNPAECMNGGSCVGNSTHFRCDCTPGFTGPLCQHSLNECESSPCVHGICVDQEDGFRCFCQPGFAGELCNFEYNECESNPCQNAGECIDHIGSYECRCTKGYTGNRCQIKVDFCANKPCPEGHRCIDHGNDFSCECPGGRNGPDCNQMPRTYFQQCNVNPCTHGGTCWSSGDSFYCACRPGYTGTMCEDEFVVETVVSSSEFIVDDANARNFNDKTFGSSVVLKSPIELHNAYFAAGVLAAAIFIVAIVVTICHCKVNQTYRKFSARSTSFIPILGFSRRPKMQGKLNKHWLSGKGLNGPAAENATGAAQAQGNGRNGCGSTSTSTSSSATQSTRHLPCQPNNGSSSQTQTTLGGQLQERPPFQRHLAMNLENDMYYTVDFSENSQHSPLIQ